MVDQEPDCGNEVRVVDPRHELTSVSRCPAESTTDQTEQHVEDAIAIRTQGDRRTERDLSRMWRRHRIERPLPRASHVDAEAPGVGCIRLVSAEDTGVFVVLSLIHI